MNIKDIRTGASVELFIYNRAGVRKSFKSKFEDITGKFVVSVLADGVAPSYTSSDDFEIFIRVGEEDYMWEGTNNGMGKTRDGYTTLKIKINNPIGNKSSRRAHFRITHLEPGELLYLDKDGNSAASKVEMINLSAGGAAFLSEIAMQVGQVNKLRFPLSSDYFILDFSVISSDDMPADFHIPFRYHCRWENMNGRIEENLVRLVFKQQQARR